MTQQRNHIHKITLSFENFRHNYGRKVEYSFGKYHRSLIDIISSWDDGDGLSKRGRSLRQNLIFSG